MEYVQIPGGNQAMEKQQLDPYANHAQAVSLWHEACRAFQQADAMRQKAKAMLDEANAILANHLQEAVCDPTVPRPATANGGLMDAQQRRL